MKKKLTEAVKEANSAKIVDERTDPVREALYMSKDYQGAVKEDNRKHQTEIFEYIRRRRHGKTLKVGVILGVKDGKVVRVGWSKCNVALDKFDTALGLQLAVTRAFLKPKTKLTPAPACILKQIRKFG